MYSKLFSQLAAVFSIYSCLIKILLTAEELTAFELWCWRRLFRVPWTAGRSNQSILKEISPEYSLEGLMLKLKLQYFGHLMRRVNSLEKTGTDWGQKEKGMTEDEMAGWHHRLHGHEFEWGLGVGDGQGGLEGCSPWGHKEADTTERLNSSKRSLSIHSAKPGKAKTAFLFWCRSYWAVFFQSVVYFYWGIIYVA